MLRVTLSKAMGQVEHTGGLFSWTEKGVLGSGLLHANIYKARRREHAPKETETASNKVGRKPRV